jgi:hypothetical protein
MKNSINTKNHMRYLLQKISQTKNKAPKFWFPKKQSHSLYWKLKGLAIQLI